MVILFLTSGLEPGKDGVGDYTRLLAAECIRRNQTCLLIALNDGYVSQPVEASESVEGVEMRLLRLPASLPWSERAKLAVNFQTSQPIDWVSLQFVCYGFNPKGVVWNLAGFFDSIIAGRPLHVMFHETWIGIDKTSSFKSRVIGKIQRHYLRRLFRQLHPRLVTTSNAFYVTLLRGIGFSAIETPLSSNLPVRPRGDGSDLPEKLIQAGICDASGSHSDRWLGLFFGALYPDWKAEPFMRIMASAFEKSGKRVCLVSAGRIGGPGKIRWEKFKERYGPAIDFVALGDCTPAQVSALMHIADFGVSNTAWHLLGKSSSTATMLDHGLPVIVTDYDSLPTASASQPENPLLHRCDESLENKLWKGLPRQPARYGGGEAAEKFIGYLTRSSGTT
jgi:hypothetical protein